MFYFLPSWYDKNRKWYDKTPLWFRVFDRMEFDDTVNQIKMFQNSEEDANLIILNYQPNLRYLLHKQDLPGVTYWSFFDDIQNIQLDTNNPINFKNLNWPQGTSFVYTPFAVIVKQNQEKIAVINFAENGNLFFIDYLKNQLVDRRFVFDDRGFLSSLIFYTEDGEEDYQDYLNENGIWQVREFLKNSEKGLEVNLNSDIDFREKTYKNWDDLILERLKVFGKMLVKSEDTFVIASDQQHNDLISSIFSKNQKIYSFFGERFDVNNQEDVLNVANKASFLVVDTETRENQLRKTLGGSVFSDKKISRISPFDTRLRLGHSQNVKELLIYFYIDSIRHQEYKMYLSRLLDIMAENSLIQLQIVSFNRAIDVDQMTKDIIVEIQTRFDEDLFLDDAEDSGENQIDGSPGKELNRIKVKLFTNEIELITALDTTRLVLDFGMEPDLYTQIASISAGIPQINTVKTDYVTHKENGWILHDDNDLEKAIHYYFDGLANWNQSLVYAVQKMSDYTSGRILKQWKMLLKDSKEEDVN